MYGYCVVVAYRGKERSGLIVVEGRSDLTVAVQSGGRKERLNGYSAAWHVPCPSQTEGAI